MKTLVHAQQTNGDGSRKVYPVPFPTVAAARRFCTKRWAPERAVLVTAATVECYEAGLLVAKEALS